MENSSFGAMQRDALRVVCMQHMDFVEQDAQTNAEVDVARWQKS